MTNTEKRKKLFRYKAFATGLFLLMCVIFIVMTWLGKRTASHWVGYVGAFAEAAMVGALADWFAVTALFHYPLGIKIPHTNIIANSKQRIGDNLGDFVAENFLSAKSIRPFIEKMKISRFAGEWLQNEKNRMFLVDEMMMWLESALDQFDDDEAVQFIAGKAHEMTDKINISRAVADGIFYLLEKGEQDKLITFISAKIQSYIVENKDMIQKRVSAKSYVLIPRFIDRKIGDKVISGLVEYYSEIENNDQHPLRQEITKGIADFAAELKTTDKWEEELKKVKDSFLGKNQIEEYAQSIWATIKKSFSKDMDGTDNLFRNYMDKNVGKLAIRLKEDRDFQDKIDKWMRLNLFRFILSNNHRAAEVISHTIAGWKEDELSQKLELEVGKDLQFIRVNGTVVGGIVGLLIYTIVHFIIG